MPYCFPMSSIKFQGHTVQNITDFDPNWAFPDCRLVAAFKSLRFALLWFYINFWYCKFWHNISTTAVEPEVSPDYIVVRHFYLLNNLNLLSAICITVKTSSISHTKFQNLNVSCILMQLSSLNSLKPGVKLIMKMLLEQHRQAMLQLHQQFYCLLRCYLY